MVGRNDPPYGRIPGCPEMGMLLGEGNVAAPVFDATLIHADAALDAALAG